jgi:hypothetical protein
MSSLSHNITGLQAAVRKTLQANTFSDFLSIFIIFKNPRSMKKTNYRSLIGPTEFTKRFLSGDKQNPISTETNQSIFGTSYQPQGPLREVLDSTTTFNDHLACRKTTQQLRKTISVRQFENNLAADEEIELQNHQIEEQPARITSYCTEIETNGEKIVKFLDINLNSDSWNCQWKDSSSAASYVDMNASFLTSLIVNPEVFTEANGCVSFEWSHVILLALYDGAHIPGNTNKSIWHSIHNNIAFAIVWPSVRRCAQTCIDALQLRASKCMLVEGYRRGGQTNIIMPVTKVQHVHFSVKTERATMSKFLTMPEKVHPRHSMPSYYNDAFVLP